MLEALTDLLKLPITLLTANSPQVRKTLDDEMLQVSMQKVSQVHSFVFM